MKRITIVLVLLLIVGTFAFSSDDFYKCSSLIDKKLDSSKVSMIQTYSANLTEFERYNLFESNKSSTGVPLLCNLILGAGIGSYIQGDTVGGTVFLCSELASAILYGASYVRMVFAETESEFENAATQAAIWSIALLGVRVAECIRPFTYAKEYNKRLSNALYGVPSIAAIPTINSDGQTGLMLSARIDL